MKAVLRTWTMMIYVGGRSLDEYYKDFTEMGFGVTPQAGIVLESIALSAKEITVEIVRVPLYEMGFYGPTRYEDACAKADFFNFLPCLEEIGPALRWQRSQSDEGPLVIATNGGHLFILREKSGIRLLDVEKADPNREWPPETVFVFMRPLKAQT